MKKLIALVLAVAMVLSLAACGGNKDNTTAAPQPGTTTEAPKPADTTPAPGTASPLAGTYQIKVWAPEAAVELTKKQINDFNSSNADGIKFEATVEAVSEADAGTNVITDVDAAGDLYFFAQDQFARLVLAGGLAQLGQGAGTIVKETNDAGAVAAASVGEDLYAYPLTADNGYFMYYDKSAVDAAHLGSLEDLIADCEASNKYFAMELENSAWYAISFFFGAGCVSEWTTDNDGKFIAVNDDINSDKGLIGAKGLQKLVTSKSHIESSDVGEFSKGAAIVVSGPWAYNDAKNILGDNLGAAELPSFTVDGQSYHMGNFSGYKLLGVKPTTDAARSASLHKLAQYLTSEAGQLERFQAIAWGPANKAAQDNAEVKANPSLAALAAQAPYSKVQGNIPGTWWDIGKVIATDIKDAADEAGLKGALESYNTKIQNVLKIDTTGFILVGAWNDWKNDDEAYRMEAKDGAFMFTLEVPQSDYMGGRIVVPGDWGTDRGCLIVTEGVDLLDQVGDPNNGDNNIVFKEAGTYVITYNEAANTITIVKK
nr:extracellular solute-binding protein [Lachnospiraceae bacterium]